MKTNSNQSEYPLRPALLWGSNWLSSLLFQQDKLAEIKFIVRETSTGLPDTYSPFGLYTAQRNISIIQPSNSLYFIPAW